MKKIISVLITLIMVFGIFSTAVFSAAVTTQGIDENGILTYSENFNTGAADSKTSWQSDAGNTNAGAITLYNGGNTKTVLVTDGGKRLRFSAQEKKNDGTSKSYPSVTVNLKKANVINSIADAKKYKVKFRFGIWGRSGASKSFTMLD